MNPLFVVPLLAYPLAATLWPAQVDGHRRAATLLLWEAVFVIIALVAGTYFARLAKPSLDGLWWGRVAPLATGHLHVSGPGGVPGRRGRPGRAARPGPTHNARAHVWTPVTASPRMP